MNPAGNLRANWWEAKETSVTAETYAPIKALAALHPPVLLELGTPWAVRIQARENSSTSPPPGSHGIYPGSSNPSLYLGCLPELSSEASGKEEQVLPSVGTSEHADSKSNATAPSRTDPLLAPLLCQGPRGAGF